MSSVLVALGLLVIAALGGGPAHAAARPPVAPAEAAVTGQPNCTATCTAQEMLTINGTGGGGTMLCRVTDGGSGSALFGTTRPGSGNCSYAGAGGGLGEASSFDCVCASAAVVAQLAWVNGTACLPQQAPVAEPPPCRAITGGAASDGGAGALGYVAGGACRLPGPGTGGSTPAATLCAPNATCPLGTAVADLSDLPAAFALGGGAGLFVPWVGSKGCCTNLRFATAFADFLAASMDAYNLVDCKVFDPAAVGVYQALCEASHDDLAEVEAGFKGRGAGCPPAVTQAFHQMPAACRAELAGLPIQSFKNLFQACGIGL
eukprot:scaffold7.g3696.t1